MLEIHQSPAEDKMGCIAIDRVVQEPGGKEQKKQQTVDKGMYILCACSV